MNFAKDWDGGDLVIAANGREPPARPRM